MNRIDKKKLIGNTLLYTIGEVVPRVISFLLLPILTRYLSTADYGISSYTNTTMTFLFVVAALSLNTFLLRNYFYEKDEESKKRLIGSIFSFICIFNIALVFLQLMLFPLLINYFGIKIPFKPFFFLAILNNFFDVISIIPLVVYRIKENAKGFVLLSLSRVVCQFLLTYILVAIYDQGLLGSYLARLYINVPFAFVYLYIIYRHGKYSFDFGKIKQALRFSIPFLPASLSYLIISTSDRLILERYIALEDLGVYSVAFTLTLALNIVTQALYKTFEQVIFKNSSHADFAQLNLRLFTVFTFCVTIAGFALALFSPEILKIATSPKFFYGYKLIPFMTISVVLSAYNTYLGTLLIAKNKEKIVSVLTLVAAVTSVGLNIILIPIYGYYGAVISSIVSVLLITIGSYCGLSFFNKKIIYYQTCVLIMGTVIVVLLNNRLFNEELGMSIFIKLSLIFALALLSIYLLELKMKAVFSRRW